MFTAVWATHIDEQLGASRAILIISDIVLFSTNSLNVFPPILWGKTICQHVSSLSHM